jgi:ABC-type Fe3+/spermidine/putrescine transport system ATPase subunit
MLELVNLMHHVKSRPARISGGEQQRVALARALVQRPKVLLLDEPLSNLDAKLRVRVREDIRQIQQRLGITTVVVTHDQDEALSISDRVAVMNSGRIEQYSDPVQLYQRPNTRFVGGFVGAMNTFDAKINSAGDGSAVAATDAVRLPIAAATAASDETRTVGVRPENVIIGDPQDGAPAVITRTIPRGHFNEVVVELSDGLSVRAYVSSAAGRRTDDKVGVKLSSVLIYDEAGTLQ